MGKDFWDLESTQIIYTSFNEGLPYRGMKSYKENKQVCWGHHETGQQEVFGREECLPSSLHQWPLDDKVTAMRGLWVQLWVVSTGVEASTGERDIIHSAFLPGRITWTGKSLWSIVHRIRKESEHSWATTTTHACKQFKPRLLIT